MVELKLESIEEQNLPRDCFISVRVGETQKLSRLAATRTYRFPQAGERRYGKIEVFRRIGACSVDIDPTVAGLRNVNVNCNDAGFGSLGLRIGVDAEEESKKKHEEPVEATGKKAGTKVKAAKEYLSKHGLEVRLSEAMQSVLRDRPDNPTEYLAMKLLGGERGISLPPLQGGPRQPEGAGTMPAYKQDRSLPTDEPYRTAPKAQNRPRQLEPLAGKTAQPEEQQQQQQQKQQQQKQQPPPPLAPQAPPAPPKVVQPPPPVQILPFGKSYYDTNFKCMPPEAFQDIHAKFPPPKKEAAKPAEVLPFKAFYNDNFKSSGAASFNQLASVGTWIMRNPAASKYDKFPPNQAIAPLPEMANDINKLRDQAREAIVKASLDGNLQKALLEVKQQAPMPTFVTRPSVGTWLMFKPSQPKPTPWAKKPSVGTWLAAKPLYEDGVKVGLAAQEKPKARYEQGGAAFVLRPSVGTWLTHLPKPEPSPKAEEKSQTDGASFALRPSVGTWLAPRPKKSRASDRGSALPASGTEKPFQFRPSVGSWLSVRLPPEPIPPKPLVMITPRMLGPVFHSTGLRPGLRIL